jgi:hypothetical protein
MSNLPETLIAEGAPAVLPRELKELLTRLPVNVNRQIGAELITRYFFPISPRSLEVWPLPTKRVNGKAIMQTANLFEIAFARLSSAPVVMSGHKTPAHHQDT